MERVSQGLYPTADASLFGGRLAVLLKNDRVRQTIFPCTSSPLPGGKTCELFPRIFSNTKAVLGALKSIVPRMHQNLEVHIQNLVKLPPRMGLHLSASAKLIL